MRLLTTGTIRCSFHLILTAGMALMVAAFPAGCQSAGPRHIAPQCESPADPAESLQRVIEACLADNGQVDYQKLIEDQTLMCQLDFILARSAEAAAKESAFYLNAYTACVLRAVVEFYPLKSLDKCPVDFYKKVFFTVAGESLNLTQLADRCRQSNDWRVDLALWKPGKSGPFLRNVIYRQDQLDSQLDQAVRDYVSSCAGIRIDHEKQQVLFGSEIWNRRERFLTLYREKYGLSGVGLAAAMMIWAQPGTQQLLANVPGFGEAPLTQDNQLNDVPHDNDEKEKDEPKFLPCGCH